MYEVMFLLAKPPVIALKKKGIIVFVQTAVNSHPIVLTTLSQSCSCVISLKVQ